MSSQIVKRKTREIVAGFGAYVNKKARCNLPSGLSSSCATLQCHPIDSRPGRENFVVKKNIAHARILRQMSGSLDNIPCEIFKSKGSPEIFGEI